MMREASVALALFALLCLGGCKDDPKAPDPAGNPAPAKATGSEPSVAPAPGSNTGTSDPAPGTDSEPGPAPAPASATLTDAEKSSLESAFEASWCLLSRRDRAGLAEVYKRYGFAGPVGFADAWKRGREAQPQWAEQTMARVAGAECAPPE